MHDSRISNTKTLGSKKPPALPYAYADPTLNLPDPSLPDHRRIDRLAARHSLADHAERPKAPCPNINTALEPLEDLHTNGLRRHHLWLPAGRETPQRQQMARQVLTWREGTRASDTSNLIA